MFPGGWGWGVGEGGPGFIDLKVGTRRRPTHSLTVTFVLQGLKICPEEIKNENLFSVLKAVPPHTRDSASAVQLEEREREREVKKDLL